MPACRSVDRQARWSNRRVWRQTRGAWKAATPSQTLPRRHRAARWQPRSLRRAVSDRVPAVKFVNSRKMEALRQPWLLVLNTSLGTRRSWPARSSLRTRIRPVSILLPPRLPWHRGGGKGQPPERDSARRGSRSCVIYATLMDGYDLPEVPSTATAGSNRGDASDHPRFTTITGHGVEGCPRLSGRKLQSWWMGPRTYWYRQVGRVSTEAVQRFCNSIAAVLPRIETSQNVADCLAFPGPQTFFVPLYPGSCYRVR